MYREREREGGERERGRGERQRLHILARLKVTISHNIT